MKMERTYAFKIILTLCRKYANRKYMYSLIFCWCVGVKVGKVLSQNGNEKLYTNNLFKSNKNKILKNKKC